MVCGDRFIFAGSFTVVKFGIEIPQDSPSLTRKDEEGRWLYPDEIEKTGVSTAYKKNDKSKVLIGPAESMSKSKKILLILKL